MKHYRDKPNPLGEEGECMLYAVSIQRKFAFLYKVTPHMIMYTAVSQVVVVLTVNCAANRATSSRTTTGSW